MLDNMLALELVGVVTVVFFGYFRILREKDGREE